MNYGTIKNCDIANGEGVRVSLFVSGCTHHCHNCFNPETWSFSYGSPFDEQAQSKLLTLLSPDYIDGLSLLGGEPFEPDNQRALVPFLKKVRAQYPGKTIWCYTGYTLESDLCPKAVLGANAQMRCFPCSMSSLMGNLSRLRKHQPCIPRLRKSAPDRRSRNAFFRQRGVARARQPEYFYEILKFPQSLPASTKSACRKALIPCKRKFQQLQFSPHRL